MGGRIECPNSWKRTFRLWLFFRLFTIYVLVYFILVSRLFFSPFIVVFLYVPESFDFFRHLGLVNLELFCLLSFIAFVLHHLCSGTHRRNRLSLKLKASTLRSPLFEKIAT